MKSHGLPDMPPPSEGGWFRKMLLSMAPILLHVFGRRSRQAFDAKSLYQGLEHYWYGPWTCALILLCEKSKTLILSPQRWVTKSATESEMRRWLIPDFTLMRMIESDRPPEVRPEPQKPSSSKSGMEPTKPSRRSERIRQLEEAQRSSRPQSRGEAGTHLDSDSEKKSDSEDNKKPRYEPPMEIPVKYVFQRVGAFVEIKPPTDDRSDAAIRRGLANARVCLMEQVSLFFSEKSEKSRKYTSVIGIYAAGHYWSWDNFTPGNTWSTVKPASAHKDGTYRPAKEKIAKASVPQVSRPYFILGQERSNTEMTKVLKAIYKLPGSEPFGDLL